MKLPLLDLHLSKGLGDTISSTPSLRKLYYAYNKKISVLTDHPDIFKNNKYVDKIFNTSEVSRESLEQEYELLVSFAPNLQNRYHLGLRHNYMDIRQFHASGLGFTLSPEEYHTDFTPDEWIPIENLPNKFVLIHPVQSWSSRTWDAEKWKLLTEKLNNSGIAVVSIGKSSSEIGFHMVQKPIFDFPIKYGLNLMNQTSISQTWWLIQKSLAFITMDSGLLHLAGTTDAQIIQLGSSINWKLRAPYRNGSQDYKYHYVSGDCKIGCASDMKYGVKEWGSINAIPPLVGCLENKPYFECHPRVSQVMNKVNEIVNFTFRVLFLAPHLSTGGMPSYLLKRIESLILLYPEIEIYVAEFCQYSTLYTVQRDRIKQLITEERFWTINTLDNHNVENSMKVMDIIKNNSIDIVHIDEMVEGFDSFNKMPSELKNALYDENRTWRVVETCHNVWFNPDTSKLFHPDAYAFCTPYHKEVTFKQMPSHKEVFEFPIENKFRTPIEQVEAQKELGLDGTKVHIINVGLWTSSKNQGEGIEIAKHFENSNVEFHFIGNQASNFESYWGPLMNNLPSNVKVWGERKDVETFMKASDILMFNSTWECNPLVIREAASFGLKIIARDLPQYVGMFNGLIVPLTDDLPSNVDLLRRLISSSRNYKILDGMSNEFAEKHYKLYKFLLTQKPTKKVTKKSNLTIKKFFINQPFLEILGDSNSEFEVKFFDEAGTIHYDGKIKSNHWIKLNRKYFTKWNTKIYENGVLIYDETLNYSGKRVFINFDSKSLGDTISWIPYVSDFKKVHNCDVVVSTYWNHLFERTYPELEFVQPGTVVHNIFGQYNLGWFWDLSKEPELPNTIPLQKAATNILGLPFREIKPKIHFEIGGRPYTEKYVTIATNSTAGCKFWTKGGWQELINHLHSLGYKIVNVSKEINPFNNCERLDDISIENTMNVIHHSEFFVGLSSGLSWLSWAIGKHVVMISNFTEANHEFTSNCTRITNPSVCNSCWNNPNYKFDKGDWNWCPVHKGTSRQFECHTSITAEMVINKIQTLLK